MITSRARILCLGAATLVVLGELLRLAIGLLGPDPGASLSHTITYGIALLSMYAVLVALTAVYFGNHRVLGVVGLVGYLTASLGTVLVAGDWWFEAFAVPMIGANAPAILELPPRGSLIAGALITVGMFAAGWTMFGVAILRSRVCSRPAAVLLVLGGTCGVLALSTPFQIPLAVAIGWMGATLKQSSAREPAAARTAETGHGAAA